MLHLQMNWQSWCMVVAFVSILFCAFCNAESGPRGKDAEIVLHIGPHKTGSTYIQLQLRSMSATLNKLGFCVRREEHWKAHHYLAGMLWAPEKGYKYNDTSYFMNCLKKNQRPVLSSETFSIFKTEEHFSKLKSFIGNHSVHVTLFYREPATLYYSVYAELTKQLSIPLRPFQYFIEDFYAPYRDVLHYKVIDRYVSVFGRENVTIIDYYGAQAKKKDLLRAMFCDVYNVLCNATIPPLRSDSNKSPDMLPYHIFYLVRNYMLAKGCKMATNMKPLRMNDIIKKYAHLVSKVPKREVSISLIKEKAKEIDKAVREEYRDIILYNNATASTLAREKLTIFEVDEVAFLSSKQWQTWMKREAAKLVREKVMIECKLAS